MNSHSALIAMGLDDRTLRGDCPTRTRTKLVALTTAYSLVWLAAMIIGISGASFTLPKLPI